LTDDEVEPGHTYAAQLDVRGVEDLAVRRGLGEDANPERVEGVGGPAGDADALGVDGQAVDVEVEIAVAADEEVFVGDVARETGAVGVD
jgi:hypothetical protein